MTTFPTQTEFIEWRKNNPERGIARSASECPIALCMRDRGFLKPLVSEHGWFDFGASTSGIVPGWAQEWILAYDGREFK